MKRIYLTILLCLVAPLVFLIWFQLFPYTLWEKEATSFFVWTPDYIHSVMAGNGGIPALIGNYLLQFYRWPLIGALLQAVFPTLILLAGMHIVHRLPISKGWYVLALLPSLILAWHQFAERFLTDSVMWTLIFIAIAVIVEVLYHVYEWRTSRRAKNQKRSYIRSVILYLIPLVMMIGFYYKAASDVELKSAEHSRQMDYYAYTSRWKDLLNISATQDDYKKKELCYVTLALSSMNMLGNELFHYPVNSEEFFLFMGDASEHGTFFNQIFYANIGVYNQAIHQAFQEATKSKNGMSFRVLMNLIKYNIAIGNEKMANKYMDILSHASCYGDWIQKQRKALAVSMEETKPEDSRTVYMTNSVLHNLYNFVQAGNRDVALNHYYLCALLIRKNLLAFVNRLNQYPYLIQQGVHQHYMEALVLANAQGFNVKGVGIPQTIIEQFYDFQSLLGKEDIQAIQRKYQKTYWYNYYFMTFPDDPNVSNMSEH